MTAEILVVTGTGQGHLNPCMELCNRLSSRHYQTTLIIPSSLSASIPSSFSHKTAPIAAPTRIMPGSDSLKQKPAQDLEAYLKSRSQIPNLPLPMCAIVDFQMGWTKAHIWKFNIPVIGLFTFGACAAAMEWGAWKVQAGDIRPGETRLIPGLPEEMGLTCSDLKRKPFGSPHTGQPEGRGPPKAGDKPPRITAIEGSIALIFNTCDDLERLFLNYMADQIRVPDFGVGPLIPSKYWNCPSGSLTSNDSAIIREHNRQSNVGEDEVIRCLDNKPRGSVLYVAFGSEVGPTLEEYAQLARALEESSRPFVWVIQSGSGYNPEPDGLLDEKVGDRGLIIRGWAPQLLILSHVSTAGFLSHCGWNSTMEAIGRGVRILAWPIRGDQFYNAKLVVNQLKVGYKVTNDLSEMVKKDDIINGIERLMGDEEMGNRVSALRENFTHGFPDCSRAAFDAFKDFVNQKLA
ncbi:hypothetical protein DITRI_Ditri04bG0082700 [Diplodiscus trichospermus]